jgi:hypothetical protein
LLLPLSVQLPYADAEVVVVWHDAIPVAGVAL